MEKELLELEKSLFKVKYISDKQYLNKILHENFKECGKSGFLYNKSGTIEYLLSCNEDRKIDIYNFNCEKIDNNIWIVHYITKTEINEKYYRTSIWIKEDNFKLFFHQASSFKLKEKLIRF